MNFVRVCVCKIGNLEKAEKVHLKSDILSQGKTERTPQKNSNSKDLKPSKRLVKTLLLITHKNGLTFLPQPLAPLDSTVKHRKTTSAGEMFKHNLKLLCSEASRFQRVKRESPTPQQRRNQRAKLVILENR